MTFPILGRKGGANEPGHYWEVACDASSTDMYGVLSASNLGNTDLHVTAAAVCWYTGIIYLGSGANAMQAVPTFTTADVIGFAYSGGLLWAHKNGTWANSGLPVSGIPGAYANLKPGVSIRTGGQATFVPEAGDQTYSAPPGFEPLGAGLSVVRSSNATGSGMVVTHGSGTAVAAYLDFTLPLSTRTVS